MSKSVENIFSLLSDWSEQGHNFALAVVISTWGSSPRQAGSMMAIRDDGLIEGSVSGGCIESSVMHTASALMEDGGTEALEFGVADETAWQVGLSCGGNIRVWVCPKSSMDEGMPAQIAEMIAERNPVYINCMINSQRMMIGTEAPANQLNGDGSCFHLAVLPQPRLFIIGAVHISQHLAPMAHDVGFDVTVIDPRETFAREARFPDINVIPDWPQYALNGVKIDANTAFVTLTHDPKIDDAALKIILDSTPFYIACLGSKKTHNARRSRLKDSGFSDDVIDRIHGPAGLNINATTPAEIAVSVLAELIAAYRQRIL